MYRIEYLPSADIDMEEAEAYLFEFRNCRKIGCISWRRIFSVRQGEGSADSRAI
jgi:hypothetical protein